MNARLGKDDDISSLLSSIQLESHRSKHKNKLLTRNFAKENVLKLKEIQKTHRKQRDEEESSKGPLKAFWQSDKYRDVPSRLSTYLETEKGERSVSAFKPRSNLSTISRSRSLDKEPLTRSKSIDKDEQNIEELKTANGDTKEIEIMNCKKTRNASRREMEPRIPKLFLPSTSNNNKTIKNVDERKNTTVRSSELRRATSTSNLINKKKTQLNLQLPKKHQLGVVPKYLVNRQKEWREELERTRREAVDPTIPPGHHLLSEEQRRETLDNLQESHRSILQQMASLPVCADTLRIQRRREELDRQLLETEEAIKIFSHSKVFIKDDE